MSKVPALLLALGLSFGAAYAQQLSVSTAPDDDQLTGDLASTNPHTRAEAAHTKASPGHVAQGINNIDSLQNFSGHYMTPGIDPNGNPNSKWYYNTVGNPPQQGGTTTFNAPIIPVSLDLRNYDGTPRYVNGKRLFYDVTPYVQLALNSPVFQNSTYTSSTVPTQFTDAVQRAEYWQSAKADWHTLLAPSIKTPRTMTLIRGTYAFSLNPDGSCCRYVIVDEGAFGAALFPATASDTVTPVGAAEHAGDITTKDISTFLFPNTFLENFKTGSCCVIGYHTYDSEPGTPANGNLEQRYVVNYSSWISPGLFRPSGPTESDKFQDITALSHEIAETFNDPFVTSDGLHNVTPFWRAPNGLCQNNLETGDVIEGIPGSVHPMTLNSFTYHPQNEALLQYFEFQQASDAFDGQFSYPDAVLTGPSALQKYACH